MRFSRATIAGLMGAVFIAALGLTALLGLRRLGRDNAPGDMWCTEPRSGAAPSAAGS